MARNERLAQLEQAYPRLTEWLQSHTRTQYYKGIRQPSAEEKIKRFGGIEQLKATRDVIGRWSLDGMEYPILMACTATPMVTYEIKIFNDLVDGLGYGGLYKAIARLTRIGQLNEVSGLTYITTDSDNLQVDINQRGYVTTQEGLQRRVTATGRTQSVKF